MEELKDDKQSAAPGVQEEVHGLLKAGHLAVDDGRLAKACELAREALALAPGRPGRPGPLSSASLDA